MVFGVIVNLEGGVRAGPGEPDHVVFAVVHLGGDVAHDDVLGAEVVVHEDLATDL